jgi:hypothetical protein
VADDLSDADGVLVLSFHQARDRARERARERAKKAAGVSRLGLNAADFIPFALDS